VKLFNRTRPTQGCRVDIRRIRRRRIRRRRRRKEEDFNRILTAE
jgi:hypothetical protein